MERFEGELRRQLAAVYRDGRWICVMTFATVAARFLGQVAAAAEFDAPLSDDDRRQAPLVGLTVHDVDPAPDDGFAILSLERPSSGDLLADTLGMAAAVEHVPGSVLEELDVWDPDRTAQVLVPPFLTVQSVAGRSVFGGRPPAWAAIEDKLAVLDVLRDAGIVMAPAEVVRLDDTAAVASAHRHLAGSHGTVWAVDNSQGLHGGAAGTHWVRSSTEATDLAERLAADHRRVRIMPFLDGVPCSIHGIVLDEATVTTRPNEMLVYVERTKGVFQYCRFGNHWDPAPADRGEMVAAASAVGEALRRRVDFRGVFSLDGVLTVDGFRPTEINPRYGMALPATLPISGGGSIDLMLLDRAIVAGRLSPDPDLLQQWLLRSLDDNRRGGASFATTNRPDEERVAGVESDGDGLALVEPSAGSGVAAPADEPVPCLATVTWAPVGAGQRLSVTFGDEFPVGPPAAPLALHIARFVDDHWNVGLDDLEPALALDSER